MSGFICPARQNTLVAPTEKVDARGATTSMTMLK